MNLNPLNCICLIVIVILLRNARAKKRESRVIYHYTACGRGPSSQREYCFDIVRKGSGYRAYIRSTPDYRGRSTDAHSTHRLYDGRYYVCWTDTIKSIEAMKAVARRWSDCTQAYIETGTRF